MSDLYDQYMDALVNHYLYCHYCGRRTHQGCTGRNNPRPLARDVCRDCWVGDE